MNRRLTRALITLVALVSLTAFAFQARVAGRPVPASLTAYVPQDALLTIESPNFSQLLKRWQTSAESKAWLASANYSVFETSRLFGRLDDAQQQFAQASGLPAGTDLLNQVAGAQSVFAWYDVGNLEFLYITRMPSAQAAQTELLNARGRFERRHAGASDFYVRTAGSPARTVAFAQVSSPFGDLLLLATREDLIANALNLIAGKGDSNVLSIAREPWFADASAALAAESAPPALHMVLNLDRIVPMPSFRSYWIQRNVTWMKQYRAAASDLYLAGDDFREERVLLPKSPDATAGSADLTQLAALPPPETGVSQALATQDASIAVTAIEEKILGHETTGALPSSNAPDPSLELPQAGSSDLETRIDTPAPVSAAASTGSLRQIIEGTGLNAVLTLSSAQPAPGLWTPIHSAVVLQATQAWQSPSVAAGLQQSLRGSLTTSTLGIDFKPLTASGQALYALTGPRPLFLATRDHLLFLTDDLPLLLALLHPPTAPAQPSDIPQSSGATRIAAFNHTTQRPAYARLTASIDHVSIDPLNPHPTPETPAFFSRNIASLSDVFSTLATERILDRIVAGNLRQTVLYHWSKP